MAAKDYIIVTGWQNAYLAKAKKTESNTMSADRRPIKDSEIIGLFEFYLRKYCEEKNTDSVVITSANGTKLFEAKLLDK